MLNVLAKFFVTGRDEGCWKPGESAFTVKMQPVMAAAGEDSIFGAATPSGSLELNPLVADTAREFNIWDRFYLRFSEADAPIASDVMLRLPMKVDRVEPNGSYTYVTLRLGTHGECPPIFKDGYNPTLIRMGIVNAAAATQFVEGAQIVVDLVRAPNE